MNPSIFPRHPAVQRGGSGALAATLLAGCAGQMPSVANFMHPDPVSIHGSIRGIATGSVREEWEELPDRPPPGECEDRSYSLRDPDLWLNQGVYVGENLRMGLDASLFGVGSVVGGLRGFGFGVMPWMNFDAWSPEGNGPGGVAVAYRWKPAPQIHPGAFGYFAVNRSLLEEPSCAMYNLPKPVRYDEAGLGGWVHFGERSNVSVEVKVGRQLDERRYRGYFAMNLHFGWEQPLFQTGP